MAAPLLCRVSSFPHIEGETVYFQNKTKPHLRLFLDKSLNVIWSYRVILFIWTIYLNSNNELFPVIEWWRVWTTMTTFLGGVPALENRNWCLSLLCSVKVQFNKEASITLLSFLAKTWIRLLLIELLIYYSQMSVHLLDIRDRWLVSRGTGFSRC